MVTIEDLGRLAVILRRHLGLEERYRWPVEVELGCDSLLVSWGFVCQLLNVLVRLDIHVHPAWDWLWCWDVSVWVLLHDAVWCLKVKKRIIRKLTIKEIYLLCRRA